MLSVTVMCAASCIYIMMGVENKQCWVWQLSTSCCLHKTMMLDECLENAALLNRCPTWHVLPTVIPFVTAYETATCR